VSVLPGTDGGVNVAVQLPVLDPHALALIVDGSVEEDPNEVPVTADLDLGATVMRLVARRLGLTVALARQAGNAGAELIVSVPVSTPGQATPALRSA
jgi:hypothetical protein